MEGQDDTEGKMKHWSCAEQFGFWVLLPPVVKSSFSRSFDDVIHFCLQSLVNEGSRKTVRMAISYQKQKQKQKQPFSVANAVTEMVCLES